MFGITPVLPVQETVAKIVDFVINYDKYEDPKQLEELNLRYGDITAENTIAKDTHTDVVRQEITYFTMLAGLRGEQEKLQSMQKGYKELQKATGRTHKQQGLIGLLSSKQHLCTNEQRYFADLQNISTYIRNGNNLTSTTTNLSLLKDTAGKNTIHQISELPIYGMNRLDFFNADNRSTLITHRANYLVRLADELIPDTTFDEAFVDLTQLDGITRYLNEATEHMIAHDMENPALQGNINYVWQKGHEQAGNNPELTLKAQLTALDKQDHVPFPEIQPVMVDGLDPYRIF